MPIIPLYGHQALRARLRDATRRGSLPASLLFHGPRGVGKQRLALWLGQMLLCEERGERPCGRCQHCRYALELAHPDLLWFFPRVRPKDPDQTLEEVRSDYTDAAIERLKAGGLYETPSGSEGIFVATVRAIVVGAGMTPALARRKVIVIGDADRMVPQEANPEAANAFLKLLEEPPDDTTIVLTTSEPGALLPTVRSRVAAIRVAPLRDEEVREFMSDPVVEQALSGEPIPTNTDRRLELAAGAPGMLLGGAAKSDAETQARRILEAIDGQPADRYSVALAQGVSKARGPYSDALEALTGLLHERVRGAVVQGDERRALATTRAIDCVERARERASRNANPQLVTAGLIGDLLEVMR